jgi:PilZ domain
MERRHLRKAVDRPSKIYLAGGEGLVCRIRDISKGGAKIRIAWSGWLPSFDLEDSFTSMRREVWVVWRETSYVGVRFTDEGQSPAVPKPTTFGRRQG